MSLSRLAYSDLSSVAERGGVRRRLRDSNSIVSATDSARFERVLVLRSATSKHAALWLIADHNSDCLETYHRPEDVEYKESPQANPEDLTNS